MTEFACSRWPPILPSGRIRVVDLTQTLSPEFPQIVAAAGVRPVLAVPHRGGLALRRARARPGTGIISPAANTRARISMRRFTGFPAAICPTMPPTPCRCSTSSVAACVIDCSREAAADADFLLTADHVRRWEQEHGRIPAAPWVLMRTDWSKRADPAAYQNFDETGQHTPGPPRTWCAS